MMLWLRGSVSGQTNPVAPVSRCVAILQSLGLMTHPG
jgi:hypothetical protein